MKNKHLTLRDCFTERCTSYSSVALVFCLLACITFKTWAQIPIQSQSTASKNFEKDAYLFCDFKFANPSFYELKNNKLQEITETGFVEVSSPGFRFVGRRLIHLQGVLYVYGALKWFADDERQILATISPMADSYIKREDLICFDMREIFPPKFFQNGVKK